MRIGVNDLTSSSCWVADGGWGTEFQKIGLAPRSSPEAASQNGACSMSSRSERPSQTEAPMFPVEVGLALGRTIWHRRRS